MENIIVAFTNITCLAPLILSFTNRDYLTWSVILWVSIASFFSHLVENHKHGMPGIGFSRTTSYMMNRLDVMGALMTICRFGYIYYDTDELTLARFELSAIIICAIIAYCFNLVSEYDKYNSLLKYRYIVCHGIWHLTIYMVMYYFLWIVYLFNNDKQ